MASFLWDAVYRTRGFVHVSSSQLTQLTSSARKDSIPELNNAGTYGRYLTSMNRNESEAPWYQIQFLSKLIVFINLRFRVKSEFEVKVGSHQLLMRTEVRILDEIA